MNASEFNLQQKRNDLVNALTDFEKLKNDLLNESSQLESDYAKKIFNERFEILVQIANVIIQYDACVMTYVMNHPDGHNVKYYRDQLEVAKRYIKANGLNWSTVVWGKISDY